MSDTTLSKPFFKKHWQRGLAIEHTLVVLLIAFTAFHVLFVLATRAG